MARHPKSTSKLHRHKHRQAHTETQNNRHTYTIIHHTCTHIPCTHTPHSHNFHPHNILVNIKMKGNNILIEGSFQTIIENPSRAMQLSNNSENIPLSESRGFKHNFLLFLASCLISFAVGASRRNL